MKGKEFIIITLLTAFLWLFWSLCIWFHIPGFPRSLLGGILGIIAAFLMFIPLAYLFIKRIKSLKKYVTKHISMGKLLSIHIYGGALGAALSFLHAGFYYYSSLGIMLSFLILITVMSGFLGRYIMKEISKSLKSHQVCIEVVHKKYSSFARSLNLSSLSKEQLSCFKKFNPKCCKLGTQNLSNITIDEIRALSQCKKASIIIKTLSSLEESIKLNKHFKTFFSYWLKWHICISLILYFLIVSHIFGEIYFGLTWL